LNSQNEKEILIVYLPKFLNVSILGESDLKEKTFLLFYPRFQPIREEFHNNDFCKCKNQRKKKRLTNLSGKVFRMLC